jgi:hypothetical protein
MDLRGQLNELKYTWRPPTELRRSRPREVLLTGAGRTLLTTSILLLLAAPLTGALLHAKAAWEREQRQMLLSDGILIPAVITRHWKSGGKESHYWVEYLYQVGEKRCRGRMEVGRSSWNLLVTGATLQVRYLPSDPQVHLVLGHENGMIPPWLPYLAATVMGAGAWLMTRPVASQRRLLSEGRPMPAIVTGLKDAKHAKIAQYSFATLSGGIVSGETSPQRKSPSLGECLCVLYEPDRPGHNSTYPLPLVRVARLDPPNPDQTPGADGQLRSKPRVSPHRSAGTA